jgi:hypothetical protein
MEPGTPGSGTTAPGGGLGGDVRHADIAAPDPPALACLGPHMVITARRHGLKQRQRWFRWFQRSDGRVVRRRIVAEVDMLRENRALRERRRRPHAKEQDGQTPAHDDVTLRLAIELLTAACFDFKTDSAGSCLAPSSGHNRATALMNQ